MGDLDFEIDPFENLVRGRLRTDPGYVAVQQIPGPMAAVESIMRVGAHTRVGALRDRVWAVQVMPPPDEFVRGEVARSD